MPHSARLARPAVTATVVSTPQRGGGLDIRYPREMISFGYVHFHG
jgi:hypothetical protein